MQGSFIVKHEVKRILEEEGVRMASSSRKKKRIGFLAGDSDSLVQLGVERSLLSSFIPYEKIRDAWSELCGIFRGNGGAAGDGAAGDGAAGGGAAGGGGGGDGGARESSVLDDLLYIMRAVDGSERSNPHVLHRSTVNPSYDDSKSVFDNFCRRDIFVVLNNCVLNGCTVMNLLRWRALACGEVDQQDGFLDELVQWLGFSMHVSEDISDVYLIDEELRTWLESTDNLQRKHYFEMCRRLENSGAPAGILIEAFLANMRLYLLLGKSADSLLNKFLNVRYADWLDVLWEGLPNWKKYACWGQDMRDRFMGGMRSDQFVRRYKLFIDKDHFKRTITEIVKPHMYVRREYMNTVFNMARELDKENEAIRLDNYYAKLVKGSMSSTALDVVWVPADETEHTIYDNEQFWRIMWKSLKNLGDEYKPSLREDSARSSSADVVKTAQRMKDIKRAMMEIWTESRTFRISNEVHMVEIMVLHRLHRDGIFPWLESIVGSGGRIIEPLKLCFMMRRMPLFRYQFASVVGKRLVSERLISSNRNNIINHHRTAGWAEREYSMLAKLVSDNGGFISSALKRVNDDDDPLFMDYVKLLTVDIELERAEEAARDMDGWSDARIFSRS